LHQVDVSDQGGTEWDSPGGRLRGVLDQLYRRYNRRRFVRPDPLQFVYEYQDYHDREVVGLIASSLAFGRVAQILKSVSSVLDRMGPEPFRFLMGASPRELRNTFRDFKHRWVDGAELAAMLLGMGGAIRRYGSLQNCFLACDAHNDILTPQALRRFVNELVVDTEHRCGSVFPLADAGSACKRMNLFLRWMVRRDEVDPGGWDSVPPRILLVPLDTHLFRIARQLGFTRRKTADMRAALEVTAAFRRISPQDPVKYDFALTRLGIRADGDPQAFLGRVKGFSQAGPPTM